MSKSKPAMIVQEGDYSISFLASMAVAEGHLLVIPKEHRQAIFDLEGPELHDILATTKLVSQLLVDRLGAGGVNLLNASGKLAQQSVDHFHIHVVPRFAEDGLDLWFGKFEGYFDARNENTFDIHTR